MTVTICIPAYRSGHLIVDTVRSVLRQTCGDFSILVAIDPSDEDPSTSTETLLRKHVDDGRVDIVVNEKRLGWAQNVDRLLGRVRSEYFAILPHDDLWSKTYLATLVDILERHPDHDVAYCDLIRFGAGRPTRKALILPPGEDQTQHILRFFIQGAHALPWRGVTRARSLARTGGFPSDDHKGFAVESEYALSLLASGPACHLASPLYFKRIHAPDVLSASRDRVRNVSPNDLLLAWQGHARRMRHSLDAHLSTRIFRDTDTALCRAALDGAMISRYQSMIGRRLPPDMLPLLTMATATAAGAAHPLAGALSNRLAVCLQRHAAAG